MLKFNQHLKDNDVYVEVGATLNLLAKKYNYKVADAMIKGKPGKNVKTMREYRMQLIDKRNDTSDKIVAGLKGELINLGATGITFNSISPNSSKFPSFSFMVSDRMIDVIIARGANKGENFEVQTVKNLGDYFHSRNDKDFAKLVDAMNDANPNFASVEIVKVRQRTGATKKEGVAIEKLGAIIGDIVLTDDMGQEWFISLKDINGNTFSSYSGAATIFDKNGKLQPQSAGADFLRAFGADLNLVQAGFDQRRGGGEVRDKLPVVRANPSELKKIFERAWGMNYFYVRRQLTGWKVFWLDRDKLDSLTNNISVTSIKYPSKTSKQISIFAETNSQKYLVEIRNSKAGEYPNDIKIKVIP